MIPAAVGSRDAWSDREAATFDPRLALPVLHAAAEAGLEPAAAALQQIVDPALDDWPLLRWQM